MVADEDSDQLLASTNNIVKMVSLHQNCRRAIKIIHLSTAIIGLSKRVNDYQLSLFDRLSVY